MGKWLSTIRAIHIPSIGFILVIMFSLSRRLIECPVRVAGKLNFCSENGNKKAGPRLQAGAG